MIGAIRSRRRPKGKPGVTDRRPLVHIAYDSKHRVTWSR